MGFSNGRTNVGSIQGKFVSHSSKGLVQDFSGQRRQGRGRMGRKMTSEQGSLGSAGIAEALITDMFWQSRKEAFVLRSIPNDGGILTLCFITIMPNFESNKGNGHCKMLAKIPILGTELLAIITDCVTVILTR